MLSLWVMCRSNAMICCLCIKFFCVCFRIVWKRFVFVLIRKAVPHECLINIPHKPLADLKKRMRASITIHRGNTQHNLLSWCCHGDGRLWDQRFEMSFGKIKLLIQGWDNINKCFLAATIHWIEISQGIKVSEALNQERQWEGGLMGLEQSVCCPWGQGISMAHD